ncbi:unnamed protein product [Schistosoma turkestanicum]|nr:unnamed protein product [Schistosoma turkestanicum]
MLDGVSNMIAELYSYLTDVQISFIKYALTALLLTSTSFYLLRRSLGKESVTVNTKKSKTRVKKSKSKSSDGRTSSSDGDHSEVKKPVVLPRNPAVVNTQKTRIPVSTFNEALPVLPSPEKDVPESEDKSDNWVTVRKGKKISDHHPKYTETTKETKAVISDVVISKGKSSEKRQFSSAETNLESVTLRASKLLPPVPQIPAYKSAGSESDGDWHEVRLSRKGRKSARQ